MGTYAEALAEAKVLKSFLEARGVKTSIELQTGTRSAYGWYNPNFSHEMSHHIVSKPSQGQTPFLDLIKRGRGGKIPVKGPLCNLYGGYDRVARIITMGCANHAGAGGPFTSDGKTIPRDQGVYYFFGKEYEGGLEDWDDDMADFMARTDAGVVDWLIDRRRARSSDCHAEHKDWARPAGRKSDRRGYTRAKGIQAIDRIRGGAPIVPDVPVLPTGKNGYAKRAYSPGQVRSIQEILVKAGYYLGAPDDDYGFWTARAVSHYQGAQVYPRLVQDSDWGPSTEAHYKWVVALQQNLNQWKSAYPDLRPDGDYRVLTSRRVVEWQKRNHGGSYPRWAAIDGLAGRVMCSALGISNPPGA